MNAAAQYLQNAEDCLATAGRMSGADKDKLLRLAAAWRELAEEELKPKASGKRPVDTEQGRSNA